jgi:hypothetical protein
MPVGTRFNGMGNASVAVSDVFSIFSNPASLTGLSAPVACMNADHRYNVSGINTLAFSYCHVQKAARVALGISRYGDELLNHTRAELAFAYKIRLVSLGGGISYQQLAVSELKTARNLLFQFGGMVELTPTLHYGASIYNMTRSKIASEASTYYPVVMQMGLSYLPIKQVLLLVEVEKTSTLPANFKMGLEYTPTSYLVLRTGINSAPSQGFFGAGVKWKEYGLDYAVTVHSRLGWVHSLSLCYFFAKKEEPLKAE